MGQKVGKARFHPAARPFLNANAECMEAVWANFNDVAEGFGLNLEEFRHIVDIPGFRATRADADAVFDALDTDENGLVDALEALTTFALASGLSIPDKVKYTFKCYDFDESGALTVDEMTLSLKSTLCGLAKLTGEPQPDDLELEDIAQSAFLAADKNADQKITFAEYAAFCVDNPEVRSWVNYYDDADEEDTAGLAEGGVDSCIEAELVAVDRSDAHEAANNPDANDAAAAVAAAAAAAAAATASSTAVVSGARSAAEDFTAVRAWVTTAANTVPSSPPAVDPSPPGTALRLSWVHGVRGFGARNNVRYTGAGDIAFTAGSLGVVYSPESHSQRYSVEHTDDVLCLAVSPDGRTVATGQVGRRPVVILWDAEDRDGVMDSVAVLSGYHSRGVAHLAFSPDGRRLVSVGLDDDHSVAVWDWRSGRRVFAGVSGASKVLGAAWIDNGNYVTVGVGHVWFWDVAWKCKKRGIFGRAPGVRVQPILNVAPFAGGTMVVTGTAGGHLYAWQGRNCVRAVKAHDGPASSLYCTDAGVVSGGRDGRVRIWTSALEPRADFDMANFGAFRTSVSSVAWDPVARKLLVATSGCEIFELNSTDGSNLHEGAVMCGHCRGELWGLAPHPSRAEVATVGDDGTLRIWDLAARMMVKRSDLGSPARSVAYSPDGTLIAVGFGTALGTPGGRTGKDDGAFMVLREEDLSIAHQARDSRLAIVDIKFSPDGTMLAAASADRRVYLYNIPDFTAAGRVTEPSAAVTALDFSHDGTFLQMADASGALLFADGHTGEAVVSAPAMKDVKWATQTCTLGWAVSGVWPSGGGGGPPGGVKPDGVVVTTVDASPAGEGAAAPAPPSRCLVGGDGWGKLRLWRFPVVDPASTAALYHGHAGFVSRVRWSSDGRYVASIGGSDRCLFVWEARAEAPDATLEAHLAYDSEDEAVLFADGAALERPPVLEAARALDAEIAVAVEDALGGGGDQFMAVKPWIGAVVEPTEPPPVDKSPPAQDLKLSWVHGYRASDTRGCVRYVKGSNGEIVYPAAALGVVLSKVKWTQRFQTGHTDDVVSLAVSPDGVFVATGQMGRVPLVLVWRVDTLEVVARLSGFHSRAVVGLAFSPDGKLLASVGLDDDHSMAVYGWATGKLVASARGDKGKVLGVAFSPDGRTVVQCGVKHIVFHSLRGGHVESHRGVFGRKARTQPLLDVDFLGRNAIVAAADGHLLLFDESRAVSVATKAHDSAVYSLHVNAGGPGSGHGGVVSGGKDGKVKLWSLDLEALAEWDVAAAGVYRSAVRSVQWVGDVLLVGTLGSEIVELSALDGKPVSGKPLVSGHGKDELWGLSWNPVKPEFVTVGDDGTARIWDAVASRMIRMTKLGGMARAVTYSPDGTLIAVGMGGRVGRGKSREDGKWVILKEDDLTVLYEARDARQWIQDIKFSPDGSVLAIAAHDNKLYLYDANADFVARATFDRHNAALTHFDFSSDGKYIQSNDAAYELLFSDAATGGHIPAASALKDVVWASQTCPLGWSVQGIWPAGADGTDINAVDRSASFSAVAAADDFGRVTLTRYPASAKGGASKVYRGHSSHVTNIRWAPDDSRVVSVGGNDRCVFVWTVETDVADEDAMPAGESGEDTDVDALGATGVGWAGGGGDEFMASRPWKGAVVDPTSPPDLDPSAPKVSVALEWVYGYQAEGAHNNVRYNAADEVVYHTAGVGVVYDKVRHAQKHHTAHDDDITALATDSTGALVATGQTGKRPRIHVWDARSGSDIAALPLFHKRSIAALGFNNDGRRIISVGNDDAHTVAVWATPSGRWTDGALVAYCNSSREKVLFATFAGGTGEFDAVTGGVKHVSFWCIKPGSMTSKKGIFGRYGKLQPMPCAAVVGGKVVTGTVSGHLYVWEGRNMVKKVAAHERTVAALYATPDGAVSGGKDGKVKLWSKTLEVQREFDVAGVGGANPAIRSVALNPPGSLVLVGTASSVIVELCVKSDKRTVLVDGHFSDELWGLVTHPTASHLVVTCGDDRTVRVWDVVRHTLKAKTTLDAAARAVAWSPDGSVIAVGLGKGGSRVGRKDGGHMILRADNLEVLFEGRDSKEWISDIKFSPDGTTLAIGSHDNVVRLYNARGHRYTPIAECTKHSSYITHFDFSVDGAVIQSNCGAYELLFYRTSDGEQLAHASALRDTEWATQTCVLGWSVQGIWPEGADGTDINAVDRSHGGELLATCDDAGRVRLLNFPCVLRQSDAVGARGHSSHVTCVRWAIDDGCLFSTGGADRSLMQWRVSRK